MEVPRGKVTTYSLLSAAVGSPGGARAVGWAVGRNQHAPFVPCHRVVKADGQLGGYSAKGGIKQKLKLLKAEGVVIKENKIENINKYLFKFPRKTR